MNGFTVQLAVGSGLALLLIWTLAGGRGGSGGRVHELWLVRARFLLPFVLLYLALLLAGHHFL
jgi:hypothetical protein